MVGGRYNSSGSRRDASTFGKLPTYFYFLVTPLLFFLCNISYFPFEAPPFPAFSSFPYNILPNKLYIIIRKKTRIHATQTKIAITGVTIVIATAGVAITWHASSENFTFQGCTIFIRIFVILLSSCLTKNNDEWNRSSSGRASDE